MKRDALALVILAAIMGALVALGSAGSRTQGRPAPSSSATR